MMSSVVRPRKSILRSASFSRPTMSYWVTISSLLVLQSGTSSFSGTGEITTPAACMPALRAMPSILQRDIQHFLQTRILLGRVLDGGLLLRCASFSLMLSVVGMSLVMRSTSAIADVEHAADVLDGGARAQRAERDDLRHLLAAVFFGDVLDHFAAAARVEIDIDIRHADALRIEEALEQQAVFERIDIGDLHRIADQAAGRRAAARADRDTARFGEADEVPDDQEVAGKLHLLDHADFAIQALRVFGQVVLQRAGFAAALPDARGVFRNPAARRTRNSCRWCARAGTSNFGKRFLDLFEADLAALRDLPGAVQRVFQLAEHARASHRGSSNRTPAA